MSELRGVLVFRTLRGLIAGGVVTVSCLVSAASQTIVDDFAQNQPASHWFVCDREENDFIFGELHGDSRTAVTAVVRPSGNASSAGFPTRDLARVHPGCRYKESDNITDGPNDRAEIWEADAVWLPVGTEVWYRFDMFIDGSIPANSGRLVIGQWKQSNAPGDASPVLAQRFGNRTFTVTIQQDDDEPGRPLPDKDCRIFIAAQAGSSGRPGDGISQNLPAQHLSDIANHGDASAEHGRPEFRTRQNARRLDALACGSDISLTTYNPLPDPFNKWTTMVYRLRIGADGGGVVEVWANGTKISRATGRIGYRAQTSGQQYFKFGPYRDRASYPIVTRLSRYMRGATRKDIDPDGKFAPD